MSKRHAEALCALSDLHTLELGVVQDALFAASFYRYSLAAKQGRIEARFKLDLLVARLWDAVALCSFGDWRSICTSSTRCGGRLLCCRILRASRQERLATPRRSFNEHPLPFAVFNERLLLQRWVSQGTLPQFAALSVFLLSLTIISIICTLACAIAG